MSYGFIQFKGTDLCMDINCSCGVVSHVDGDFGYNVQCPACGTAYQCNPHISLVALDSVPDSCLLKGELE